MSMAARKSGSVSLKATSSASERSRRSSDKSLDHSHIDDEITATIQEESSNDEGKEEEVDDSLWEEEEEEEEEEEGEGEDEDDEEEHDMMDIDKEEVHMKAALRKIHVKSPELIEEDQPLFDPAMYPPSYKDNNSKERKAILVCKRFLKHYQHLYDERRPIFLKPMNEFGVEKLVCTTICPTQLPYRDLLNWPDIATFLSNYLIYKKLPQPTELPETLYAPQTVLARKRGHCFEFSTTLCSMLIASGYDAYVVSGYATREVANRDLAYTKCPLIEEDLTVHPRPITLTIKKYTVRPPRWNQSEYLLRMRTKKDAEFKKEDDEQMENRRLQKALDEAPPEDELGGWRIHSWVLVLQGRRNIKESFFIEPTRGDAFLLDWDGYLGIESLWNNKNYYVNVQQDQSPYSMEGLLFDIGDSRDWEYVFAGQDLHITRTPSETLLLKRKMLIEEDLCEEEEFFDLPETWSLPLKVSRADYDLRYPNGLISRRWYKCKVDRFAPYLHPDGLVLVVSVFYNLECEDLHYTEEFFEHRSDFLYKRFSDSPTGKVLEYFADGRDDALKEHHYYVHTPGPETRRTLVFYLNRRLDSMYKRGESPTFLKEWYEHNRPDRKTYSETTFGPDGRLYERGLSAEARPIETLTETYCRNRDLPANRDIAKVIFTVCKDTIDIEYQVEDDKLYGSTRHFNKPDRWWDDSLYLDWKMELHSEFQADVYARPLCELVLFQMMVGLMGVEATSRSLTRVSEKQTIRLLQTRANDVAKLTLVRTYVDADIIPSFRVARLQEKARKKAAIALKKADILKDYLQPYMQRFGLAKVTNKKQAMRITEALMTDLRDVLINTANKTKADYEEVKEEIRDMQMLHVYNFSKLTMEEMNDYHETLVLKLFLGHILAQRINSMKSSAPIKYRTLYEQIKADPRMSTYMPS